LIIEISGERGDDLRLPDWELIHEISRDRHDFRSLLLRIDNQIRGFRRRIDENTRFPFDLGPKTADAILTVLKRISPEF